MLKKFFLYIAILSPLLLSAQTPETFIVNGRLNTVKTPLRVYLSYLVNNKKVLDSTVLVDGSFQFTGKIPAPVSALMLVDHKGAGFKGFKPDDDVLSFYLEKGNIYIAGADSISNTQITGSAINADNEQLSTAMAPIYLKGQQLQAEQRAATADMQRSAVYQNTLQDKFQAIQKEREAALRTFIIAHPDSYLSLMALSSMGGPSADLSVIEPLYNNLATKLKETDAGKKLQQSFVGLRATAIGVTAPDFTQPDTAGNPIKLSSLRGKYVLLDFWSSNCEPCLQSYPNLVRVYEKYYKKFTVLGVSLDKATYKTAWLNAIKQNNLDWTQVSDFKEWNNEAAMLYYVNAIPQNFLIDPDGKIVGKNLRGAALEGKLIELLLK
ncbi:TlpA disulfide reductase family protein [Mucilaginibacter sp. PAMB04274]|uniref:TlpA disulfide reductase family protein n=1 Tax=Mucilaginibacter sp. PAMB04274 TaxID=3138568 RepID=UPI0031F668D2